MKTINNANETKSNRPDSVQDMMAVPRPIVTMAKEFPAGHFFTFHHHKR